MKSTLKSTRSERYDKYTDDEFEDDKNDASVACYLSDTDSKTSHFTTTSFDSDYNTNLYTSDVHLNLIPLSSPMAPNFETLELDVDAKSVQEATFNAIRSVPLTHSSRSPWIELVNDPIRSLAPGIRQLVKNVDNGLRNGYKPKKLEEGTTGAFSFMGANGRPAAVYKPDMVANRGRKSWTGSFESLKSLNHQIEDKSVRQSNASKEEAYEKLTKLMQGRVFELSGGRKGINPSETVVREVVASLLDENRFVGLPVTFAVRVNARAFENVGTVGTQSMRNRAPGETPRARSFGASNFLRRVSATSRTAQSAFGMHARQQWVQGSLQEYIVHHSTSEDVGSSKLDQEAIHRIGIFDLRVMNLDRHEGNVLLVMKNNGGSISDLDSDERSEKSDKFEVERMVPIDHGLILPDWENIDDDIDFCWMQWPQSKKPFSPQCIEYVRSLDAEKDCEKLLQAVKGKIPWHSLFTLKIGTLLLKKGILSHGLNLFQLGSIVRADYFFSLDSSSSPMKPLSPLNEMIIRARDAIGVIDVSRNERSFLRVLGEEIDAYMLKLKSTK